MKNQISAIASDPKLWRESMQQAKTKMKEIMNQRQGYPDSKRMKNSAAAIKTQKNNKSVPTIPAQKRAADERHGDSSTGVGNNGNSNSNNNNNNSMKQRQQQASDQKPKPLPARKSGPAGKRKEGGAR
jgi:hypothetical protein